MPQNFPQLENEVHNAAQFSDWQKIGERTSLANLISLAGQWRDAGHGDLISYSKKVFIPLTQLCRDVCHYCTFAKTPKQLASPYLSLDQVLDIAKAGQQAGCHEALFTLGDSPESRYDVARNWLGQHGYASTIEYMAVAAERVWRETGLLPHLNPGLMNQHELQRLRVVSVSMGIMLESASNRLGEKGQVHFGSPDKEPARRLECIQQAGEAAIPFTTGILIGIGETRDERIESLLALHAVHTQYGHLQEVIIQNFRAKANTKMAAAAEPDLNELLWTIAMARLIFGPQMNIQAPPNLSPGVLVQLVRAGINDWGGVSPVTPDYVNPEAPWPHLTRLESATARAGKQLIQRLAIYPSFAVEQERWLHESMRALVLDNIDAQGFVREERWAAGALTPPPQARKHASSVPSLSVQVKQIMFILQQASQQQTLSETQIEMLFQARGVAFERVCDAANELRKQRVGNSVTYVVNRNINYTNVCYFRCQFCAFSKGKASENLRGKPYILSHEEIARRTLEAWHRGATEVCLQGGIHPDYTGQTYLDICHSIKQVVPQMHIHAFSPLEVWQGAKTLGLSVSDFLLALKAAGLGSLPGTAAEILDDEVRAVLCPDKITTAQWFEVIQQAHQAGLKTTATIMFGHLDHYKHWARHLLQLKQMQAHTGGFTELAILPFVHMQSPLYLKGRARRGPTYREAILMHAVARLVLDPQFSQIQTSWTKLGREGALACLNAGANDLGGTLMNETITRAAGASHGQENSPEQMERWITAIERSPVQRNTLYHQVSGAQRCKSFGAAPLTEPQFELAQKYERTSQHKGAKRLLVRTRYRNQTLNSQDIV